MSTPAIPAQLCYREQLRAEDLSPPSGRRLPANGLNSANADAGRANRKADEVATPGRLIDDLLVAAPMSVPLQWRCGRHSARVLYAHDRRLVSLPASSDGASEVSIAALDFTTRGEQLHSVTTPARRRAKPILVLVRALVERGRGRSHGRQCGDVG